jgi:hypothetical protein
LVLPDDGPGRPKRVGKAIIIIIIKVYRLKMHFVGLTKLSFSNSNVKRTDDASE